MGGVCPVIYPDVTRAEQRTNHSDDASRSLFYKGRGTK